MQTYVVNDGKLENAFSIMMRTVTARYFWKECVTINIFILEGAYTYDTGEEASSEVEEDHAKGEIDQTEHRFCDPDHGEVGVVDEAYEWFAIFGWTLCRRRGVGIDFWIFILLVLSAFDYLFFVHFWLKWYLTFFFKTFNIFLILCDYCSCLK